MQHNAINTYVPINMFFEIMTRVTVTKGTKEKVPTLDSYNLDKFSSSDKDTLNYTLYNSEDNIYITTGNGEPYPIVTKVNAIVKHPNVFNLCLIGNNIVPHFNGMFDTSSFDKWLPININKEKVISKDTGAINISIYPVALTDIDLYSLTVVVSFKGSVLLVINECRTNPEETVVKLRNKIDDDKLPSMIKSMLRQLLVQEHKFVHITDLFIALRDVGVHEWDDGTYVTQYHPSNKIAVITTGKDIVEILPDKVEYVKSLGVRFV